MGNIPAWTMSAEVARGSKSKASNTGEPNASSFAEHGAYRAKAAQAAFLVGYFQSEPVS